MICRRVVALALLVTAGSVETVRAQVPAPGKSATPGAEPWALPAELLLGQPNTSSYECAIQFKGLRSEVERRGIAARSASEKHASREEMCKLVTAYGAAETEWIEFVERNMTPCGIPMEIVAQMKTVHAKTADGQKKLCAAGLGPGELREHHRFGPPGDYRFGPPTQPSDPPVKNFPRLSGR